VAVCKVENRHLWLESHNFDHMAQCRLNGDMPQHLVIALLLWQNEVPT
jgi:hypothetical protein